MSDKNLTDLPPSFGYSPDEIKLNGDEAMRVADYIDNGYTMESSTPFGVTIKHKLKVSYEGCRLKCEPSYTVPSDGAYYYSPKEAALLSTNLRARRYGNVVLCFGRLGVDVLVDKDYLLSDFLS
ncbi:hypothetical protein [Rhodopirellula sallentina]|uniref:hypothetical protein n=1 Tax=Rhodopirellula sallentina TaxID=1263869 RepID=UPI0005C7D58A|nr:hypothetical protein [Rhodopirellula sallentina]